MLVALGFVLCALVVLLFGRVIWNVAVKLGTSRSAKQIPVAMMELQADRDRLRVEHAMMARKLELRVQDIKLRMTEQMAEVSRNRNRIQTLVQDLASKSETLTTRETEIQKLSAEIAAYKADLANLTETIKHLTSTNATTQDENRRLISKLAEAQSALKMNDFVQSKWAQQMNTGTSPTPVMASQPMERTSEDRIKQRIHELTNVSAEISNPTNPIFESHPAPQILAAQPVTLEQKLVEAEREANAMTEELRSLDKMLQGATTSDKPVAAEAAPQEEPKQGPVANVISLAQRIKALQFDVKE